jgi:Protein of unknown function (DUF2721)
MESDALFDGLPILVTDQRRCCWAPTIAIPQTAEDRRQGRPQNGILRKYNTGGQLVERFPMLGSDQSSVESVTHVIQVALTPVFLLTAVAALLNVFSARLGRVADRVDKLSEQRPAATDTEFSQLDHLKRRSHFLDVAVVLATIAGVATSGAAVILFVGALREAVVRSMLFVLFGGAIFFTIAALFTFAIETIMAGRGLRAVVRKQQETAVKGDSDRP